MCWGVKQLDAVNELTSLFAPRSDAGHSLMIDIRSSAKIHNYVSLLQSTDKYSCKYSSLLPFTIVRPSYCGNCTRNFKLFELGIALINLLCCTPLS